MLAMGIIYKYKFNTMPRSTKANLPKLKVSTSRLWRTPHDLHKLREPHVGMTFHDSSSSEKERSTNFSGWGKSVVLYAKLNVSLYFIL